MKYLFIGFLIFGFLTASGQTKNKFDTLLLQKAIETGAFSKELFLCRFPDLKFKLIDPYNLFTDCKLTDSCGASIVLIHSPIYTKKNFLRDTIFKTKMNNMVVYNVIKNKHHEYTIYFVHPHSGSTVSITLVRKKQLIKMVGYGEGAF